MRIALLDDYQSVALQMGDWSRLKEKHEIKAFSEHIADEAALAEQLADVEILCIMRERTPVMRSLIERLPKLRLIVTTGGAHASLDMAAASDHRITVCHTASSRFATAELTFGLLLALARRIVAQHNSVQAGGWQLGLGEDVRGKTLGIVGLGNLGAQVAGLAKAFGMIPIAWSQNITDEKARAGNATPVSKVELFKTADFVTIHYKLSERSRGIVGAEDIARMKPTAYLINTSRGALVDENALISAIENDRIAGAALDVFETEPLPPDHVFRSNPKVIVTPHVGYVTRENYRTYYREIVENIEAWLAGKPVRVLNA